MACICIEEHAEAVRLLRLLAKLTAELDAAADRLDRTRQLMQEMERFDRSDEALIWCRQMREALGMDPADR